MFLCMLVFKFTLIKLVRLVLLRLLPFNRPYNYLDTPITDMVYGHCMAKSSAFLKQMSSESSSSLNIYCVPSFFYSKYSTLFRRTKEKKKKIHS